jgi:hypothetical protein
MSSREIANAVLAAKGIMERPAGRAAEFHRVGTVPGLRVNEGKTIRNVAAEGAPGR